MTALTFDAVTLAPGGRVALRDVSFAVDDAEFIGVIGPNGAGKTSLMRAVLGLLPPRHGTVRVMGSAPRRGQPLVGYMPQGRAVPTARLRGRELLSMAIDGHRLGWPWAGRRRHRMVDRVLALTRSDRLADRPLGDLSGGERQRLLLAQALLGEPRLLLLDEPLAGLDPQRQTEMVAVVREAARALRIPVLFSAHDLNPLLGTLDRVLYLAGGAAAIGPVDDVVTTPTLSRLYGMPIDVVRLPGRVFVIAGTARLEDSPCCTISA